jgi:hypothetical protein
MLTPRAQRQLGGLASFSAGQSTLRSISFPLLTTVDQTAAAASVELRSSAVHSSRVDHVCGTVGLVRSGSGWLLDVFNLDTCAAAPARGPGPKPVPPGRARGRGHGKAHGEGG